MNYDEELTFAKDLAKQAAKIMLTHFRIGVAADKKHDNTLVTKADNEINAMVIQKINQKFPDHGILAEEGSDLRQNAEFVWVCDPIDGTLAYTFGVPTNVFALTLTRHGEPQLAVVYDPYMCRMFWTHKGQGAYFQDRRLHVNTQSLGDAVIGRSSIRSPFVDSLVAHTDIERACYRVMTLGSTIYEGVLVAAGQMGASIYVGTGAHDCAAKLFVEEAGGRVTDLFGNDQRYDQSVKGMITSNSVVHDDLLAIVKRNLLGDQLNENLRH